MGRLPEKTSTVFCLKIFEKTATKNFHLEISPFSHPRWDLSFISFLCLLIQTLTCIGWSALWLMLCNCCSELHVRLANFVVFDDCIPRLVNISRLNYLSLSYYCKYYMFEYKPHFLYINTITNKEFYLKWLEANNLSAMISTFKITIIYLQYTVWSRKLWITLLIFLDHTQRQIEECYKICGGEF